MREVIITLLQMLQHIRGHAKGHLRIPEGLSPDQGSDVSSTREMTSRRGCQEPRRTIKGHGQLLLIPQLWGEEQRVAKMAEFPGRLGHSWRWKSLCAFSLQAHLSLYL